VATDVLLETHDALEVTSSESARIPSMYMLYTAEATAYPPPVKDVSDAVTTRSYVYVAGFEPTLTLQLDEYPPY
jgi:hypothetical protein